MLEFRIITSGDCLPVHCFQVEIEIKKVDNSEINPRRKANYRFSPHVMLGLANCTFPRSVVGGNWINLTSVAGHKASGNWRGQVDYLVEFEANRKLFKITGTSRTRAHNSGGHENSLNICKNNSYSKTVSFKFFYPWLLIAG